MLLATVVSVAMFATVSFETNNKNVYASGCGCMRSGNITTGGITIFQPAQQCNAMRMGRPENCSSMLWCTHCTLGINTVFSDDIAGWRAVHFDNCAQNPDKEDPGGGGGGGDDGDDDRSDGGGGNGDGGGGTEHEWGLGTGGGTGGNPGNAAGARSLANQLARVLRDGVFPFLCVASVLWAVWIGIEFGRAKDSGTRQKAKERLVKAVASVIIVLVLWSIMFGVSAAVAR